MSDRLLVPLPDGRWLALSAEAFEAALEAGAEVFGPPTPLPAAQDETLLSAEELSAKLGNVPVTWIESAGRDGRIPSVECGRWRRFRRSAVEAALAANGHGARA